MHSTLHTRFFLGKRVLSNLGQIIFGCHTRIFLDNGYHARKKMHHDNVTIALSQPVSLLVLGGEVERFQSHI